MEQLTKKEMNRINSSLNQSKLNFFDTNEKMSSKEMVTKVSDSMKKCTPDIKRYLDILLCGSNTDSYYRNFFKTVDSEGIVNIAKKCGDLEENNNALGNISIRTVFGGTERMPFRALVYILPALNLCEELKKVNKDNDIPNIEFLFMNGAGILANALDPYKADKTTAQFITVAKKYIEEYHPSLKEKVNFYVDRNFSSNIVATEEYQQVHKALEKKLSKEESLRDDLLDMGKRRNSSNNSIRYAALHTFVQDGNIDPSVAKMSNFFDKNDRQNSELIISIGAKPEEKFFKARKLVAEAVSGISYFSPKETVQYIANINVPPYSPLRDGELYLSDVLKNPNSILNARKVDRKTGEYCEYQVPVQKAVESIIMDTEQSQSDKDICEFMQECAKDKEKIEREEK